jgi:hypothetical protein
MIAAAIANKDLLIAASTIWVVITAVLVMFMQAGFAFLEAGLTAHEERRPHRRQERAHLRYLLDRLLGGRVRDRVRDGGWFSGTAGSSRPSTR